MATLKEMMDRKRQQELEASAKLAEQGKFTPEKGGAVSQILAEKMKKKPVATDISPKVSAGLGAASQLASAVGSGDAVSSTLGGAANLALAGSKFGAPGAIVGGAIGGTVGLLKGISASKQRKRQEKVARIGEEAKEKQQALANIMSGFRSALVKQVK